MTHGNGEGGSPIERRKHQRLRKSLPVHVRIGRDGARREAEILNIGAGGVLLRTELEPVTNDQVIIELDLAGEPKPISVYGTVVRSEARGVGISFVRISEITSELIAYLIRKWEREGTPHG